jgi:aminoglycoside phosphotransferase (APT) family kinase protein
MDNETLESHLTNIISNEMNTPTAVEVISRMPAIYSSTYRTEVITCKINKERFIELRCKYLEGYENNREGGHRGGVEYEAKIYEHLLRHINLPVAHYYGKLQIQEHNVFCMMLEYLKGSERINETLQPAPTEKAAAWIGAFHAAHEMKHLDFVIRYDENYYGYWVANVKNIVQELDPVYPWFHDLCTYFLENIHILTQGPQTLIHGEYYPHNILIRDGVIYPVDWESTASGPGEIDLASITEGYDENEAEQLIQIYSSSRWPGKNMHTSKEFRQRLMMSRIYFHFRWIGTYSSLEIWKKNAKKIKTIPRRMSKLHQLAKEIIVYNY